MRLDPLWPFRRRPGGLPLIYGHRGARGAVAENTLAAFEAAKTAGADGIELDVRLSRSGDLVVAHDPTLARITSGRDGRAVAELETTELERVDAGGGERVPRLVDVLALARRHGLIANVEMKRDVPDRSAVARALGRALHAWDPAHAVLVSSFDPRMLAALRVARPRTPLALLVHRGGFDERTIALARPGLVEAAHIERTLASPERVRELIARGLVVNVWTVNEPDEARDLAELGVDGLITDAPAELRAALLSG